MRNLLLLIGILLIKIKIGEAQNLVPNAGFEIVSGCPSAQGEIYLAASWNALSAPSELFRTCSPAFIPCASVNIPVNFAGNSSARSGSGYAGITALSGVQDFRSYIHAPLINPLNANKIYKVEAWFRRSSISTYAVKTLGITLSVGPLTQFGTLNLGFSPQVESAVIISDTSAWTIVSGYIMAAGGENYITLGNFKDDQASGRLALPLPNGNCMDSTAYYYIDDIKLEAVSESVIITGDSLICPGTFATLYANANTPTWWSLASDPSKAISNANSLTVSPAASTTYFLNGIFYKDSFTVNVIAPPVLNLPDDSTICENDSVFLNAININADYLWSTGETTPVIYADESQLYWVKVNNGGCEVSDTFQLSVLMNGSVYFGSDTTFCTYSNNTINLDAGDGISYHWLPGNENTRNINVKNSGTYRVSVQYANGCSKEAAIIVKESCEPSIYLPSSFTPDDNGMNDVLCFNGTGYTNALLMIYNRWGAKVFQSTNSSFCWNGRINGTDAPAGTYGYVLYFSKIAQNGTLQKERKSGTVLLIR